MQETWPECKCLEMGGCSLLYWERRHFLSALALAPRRTVDHPVPAVSRHQGRSSRGRQNVGAPSHDFICTAASQKATVPALNRAPFMPDLNGTQLRSGVLVCLWHCAHCISERDSVLDCVRQAWARRRFRWPDCGVCTKSVLHLSKAVSPMQACALHLCHRSPRRCRVLECS